MESSCRKVPDPFCQHPGAREIVSKITGKTGTTYDSDHINGVGRFHLLRDIPVGSICRVVHVPGTLISEKYDLLAKEARIIDGTGNLPYRADAGTAGFSVVHPCLEGFNPINEYRYGDYNYQ